MGLFDSMLDKVSQAADKVAQATENTPERQAERQAKQAAKQAAKVRKQNHVGWATGYYFPIGTKVFLADDDNERVLELEAPNGEIFVLSHDKIKAAHPPVLGIIAINQESMLAAAANGHTTQSKTLIHGSKYLVELNDGNSVMLSIILGEPMYKVESIIY